MTSASAWRSRPAASRLANAPAENKDRHLWGWRSMSPTNRDLLYSRQPVVRCRCPHRAESTQWRRLELRQQMHMIFVNREGSLERGIRPPATAEGDHVDPGPLT